jgi:hypothetical protein
MLVQSHSNASPAAFSSASVLSPRMATPNIRTSPSGHQLATTPSVPPLLLPTAGSSVSAPAWSPLTSNAGSACVPVRQQSAGGSACLPVAVRAPPSTPSSSSACVRVRSPLGAPAGGSACVPAWSPAAGGSACVPAQPRLLWGAPTGGSACVPAQPLSAAPAGGSACVPAWSPPGVQSPRAMMPAGVPTVSTPPIVAICSVPSATRPLRSKWFASV